MKKLLGLFIVFALFFVSCASQPKIDYTYPQSGNIYNAAPIPVKDYETLGIIFAESTEITDENGNHNGSKITFAMLMREAAKLGADDVINLRIDVQEIKELIPSNDFGGMVSQTTYKYTATALAIKYTEAIINTDGITHSQVSGNSNMLIPLIPEITPETQKKSQSPQARMMYLGGFISLGGASWNEEYNNFGNIVSRSNGSPLVSGGVVFNFVPLRFALSNIFAFKLGLETMLGITYEFDGGGIYPIIPIQATVGADIGPVGFSVNAGYAILMGLAWGATLDVNLGSGKLFLQYLAVPSVNPDTTGIDGVTVNKAAVGYKFGLGK